MRDILRLQRANGGERRENRIAVIRTAAAVELAVFDYRLPRAQALAPAAHLRLLIQMAIEQHRLRRFNLDVAFQQGPRGSVAFIFGDIDIDRRRACWQAHHF